MNFSEDRKRLAVVSVAALLVIALIAGLWHFCSGRRLAKVQELRQQLRSEASRSLPPEQRRELWGQLRQQVAQLSPTEHRELDKERREQMAKYFAMSKKEQTAYLDSQIKRMEAARKEWQANQQAQANQRPNNNGQPRMRSFDPEEREKRRKERLDYSSAEERAQRSQYIKDLNQRRQEIGLPPMRGGRGGGGGPGFGGGRP